MLWRVLLVSCLAVVAAGCQGDACKDLPPQVQIDVQLEPALMSLGALSDVAITVDEQAPLIRRFNVADPSFVFELPEDQTTASQMHIAVSVLSIELAPIAAGSLEATLSAEGCNRLVVPVLTTPTDADAGGDVGNEGDGAADS